MRLLSPLFFILAATSLQAEPVYLIFSNGMRNTLQDAELSLQQLRLRVDCDRQYQEKRLRRSIKMPWKSSNLSLAYNFKNELIEELREVYRQKSTERSRTFWKWYYSDQESSDEFKKIVMEEMMACEIGHRIGETLFEQGELYEDLFRRGFRVITVSHSQGNLFSNSIYESKFSANEIKIPLRLIGVATPASYVAGSGPYVTLTSDGVINNLLPMMLDDKQFQPLPPNTTNKSPEPGYFDHGFVEHYLGGDEAGRKILNHIYDVMIVN